MPNLDAKTVQRFLFSNIDILSKEINNKKSIKTSDLHTKGKRENLEQKEVSKLLFNQRSLVTNSGVVTSESAKELFQNKQNSDGTVDLKYAINHYVFMSFDDGVFYFNIDELNATNGGRFFISSVDIQNESKDAFTNRSNYTVKLKIYFTFFDDLLGDYVTLTSTSNKNLIKKIPLIRIIYPYFTRAANNNTNIYKEIKEQNGIILSQELNFLNGASYFKKTTADLGNSITKNFHLTNKKHTINVFAGNDPIFKKFENEIYIEYVAFEADPSKKVFTNGHTPTIMQDLYEILNIKNFEDKFAGISYKNLSETIQKENEQIKQYQKNIDCYNLYSDGKNLPQGKKPPQINITEELEKIGESKKRLENLKFLMKRLLVRYIIDSCEFWEVECPTNLLVNYSQLDWWSGFKTKFSWKEVSASAFGGAAAGAAGGAIGFFGVGAIPGAGLGFVGGAASDLALQAVSAINTVLYSVSTNTRLDSNTKIRSISSGNILNIDGFRLKGTGGETEFYVENKGNQNTSLQQSAKSILDKITSIDDSTKKEVNKFLETIDETKLQLGTTKVRFVTFKDIANFLVYDNNYNNTKKTKIFYGGNVIFLNEEKKSIFYNYSDIPISLNAFFNFLKTEIMDKETLSINIEVFVRNAFETLVKNSIKIDESTTSSVKELIPSTVRMHSNIIKLDSFKGCDDLLTLETIRESKINLKKGNNIKASDNNLQKIYFFIGEEELKYYNFYDEYQNLKNVPAKELKNFSSKYFQEFILNEHQIPCILLNYVAMEETFLKQKQIVFSRIDNANLMLGNSMENDNTSILRLPYQFNAKLKAYMTFFTDIASFIFIAPPYASKEINVNTFGYGGLYMVTKSSFEYTFQRIVNGKPTIPNLDASVNIVGRRITDGTSIKIQNYVAPNKIEEECKDMLIAEKQVTDFTDSTVNFTMK